MRICERNKSEDTKVGEEQGGGGAPGTGEEFPLLPVEKTIVMQTVPLQPMEVNCGADIHCSLWRTPQWSRWMPEGGCEFTESRHWSRILVGPAEL